MKCQICKEQEVAYAWQPFGPNETPDSYTLIGSHYRGFPVIKACSSCKMAFQSGDFPVKFEYQGHHFVGENHRIKEVNVSLWLGESHRTSELTDAIPVRAIMRDALHGIDIAALVFDDSSDLIASFLAAPQLVEACRELLALRDRIEWYLLKGLEAGRIDELHYKAILMALAKVHVAMLDKVS